MTLTVHFYADATKAAQFSDLNHLIHPDVGGGGLRFSTNWHGYAAMEAPLIAMSLQDAFAIFGWRGTPHVVVSDTGGDVAWEGRVESIAIVPGGVRLGAFGYWRALRDVPYTALWSDTSTQRWRTMTEEDDVNYPPSKYSMDKNNRLYVALKKNEVYANNGEFAAWVYERPHNSNRTDAMKITFDYDITLPTNWIVQIRSYDDGFAGGTNETTVVTGNGSNQTGSVDENITSGKEIITIRVYNSTGSSYTNTGESDAWFVRITNVRVTSRTTTNVVYAAQIVAALVSHVNGINSGQLSSDTSLIEATSDDLNDELYEDDSPAAILDRLAGLHNYEVGIWKGQRLHFRPEGNRGRAFYVDVTRIVQLERDLDNLYNSAYARYRDANGRTLRTAVSDDAASQSRYGIVRRGFVNVQTTSATEAQTHRDAFLTDRKDFALRATIEFDRLFDAAGGEYPLYVLRSGDTLTMRNLPPTISPDIDNIRTFRVAETEYDAVTNEISVSPKAPVPTLVTLIARREAGLTTVGRRLVDSLAPVGGD